MNFRLILAPQWVRAVVYGAVWAVPFGMWMIGKDGRPDRWAVNLAFAALAGIAFGVWMGVRSQPRHQLYSAVLDGLSATDRAAAIAATSGGGLPSSPAVRKAATGLSRLYLDAQQAQQGRTRLVIGLLMAMAAGLAIVDIVAGKSGEAVWFVVPAVVLAVSLGWRAHADARMTEQAQVLAGRGTERP